MVTSGPLYNACGCHLSLDFVNSIGRTTAGTQNERLVDYAALLTWSAEAGCLPAAVARRLGRRAEAHPRAAQVALTRARELREALFEVFLAGVEGRRAPAVALARLNAELARSLARARLEESEEAFAWDWAWDEEALDAPLWPLARAAAELLVSPDRERVKACASDCLWLFVDRSRNGRRRWCEMAVCGNREKVREHRRRAKRR